MGGLERVLVYGATGYTGRLIAALAVDKGLKPIIAGRSAESTAALADELELPHRVFGLDDPSEVDAGLADVDVVLHCAGPFERLSPPMVAACLRTGTHYLDITGEIPVFEALAAQSDEAREAGVLLLPGVGFDVVPTDCLAAHLAGRMPDATHLTLALGWGEGGLSHGTATTAAESLGRPGLARVDGVLVPVPLGHVTRDVDFGGKVRRCSAIPWGDVSTAYYSTGIGNIVTLGALPTPARIGLKAARFLGPLLRTRAVKGFVKRRIDAAPAGPSEEVRRRARTSLWGEVRNAAGDVCTSVLRAPEGYTLTARCALEIAARVAAGEAKPGFQTPSLAFGADFILEIEGVERRDL